MRSATAIVPVLLVFAFASCSKEMDDKVYIRFENISDRILQRPSMEIYTQDGHAIQLTLGGISPGDFSAYTGFERMTSNYGMPILNFNAIVDGAIMRPAPWCGVGTVEMTPGHYTAEVWIDQGYLFVKLKQ